MSRLPVKVSILHDARCECSLCHGPGPFVRACADSEKPGKHFFLFCEVCSTRLGVVGAAMGNTERIHHEMSGG